MSTLSVVGGNGVLQGFSANAVGHLTRRVRLTRTLVLLSLVVVMAAGFAAQSGAGDLVTTAPSYVTVIVPSGATLWSVASAYSTGDVAAMIEQIRDINNLKGYDVVAGERLRVPVK